MNTFIDKVRDVLTAVIGKILLGVFGISFIITLLLSIAQKNGVLVSISKAIMSAVFITLIFYILYFILNKVLSDVINEVNIESNDISFDVENSSIADYNSEENHNTKQEEKEDGMPLEIVSGNIISDNETDIAEEIMAKEKIAPHNTESVVDKKPEIKNNSIDKKDKLSYDNKENKSKSTGFDTGFVDFSSNDDIGSIIFADKVNAAVESSEKPSSSSSTSGKASSEGFIDFSKAAKANPDMMAKAIRSMRSKDEEK